MDKLRKYERFIEAHPEVEVWLRNRPKSTRRNYASYLQRFCETMNITPEEWRRLDRKEARDMAWQYVEPMIAESSGVAKLALLALKSWYRNYDGEQLPFDTQRGGKHYFTVMPKKRSREHIPNKNEMYHIIDMASSLRDQALLFFLFQSGVRVNVLEHITYGDISDQLDEEIITLKITPDLDYKLRGRNIPFYYTFLNGEGAETLRRYCELRHKNSKPHRPLFSTSKAKPISQRWVWQIVKMCVERAGFKPNTISTHTIRKAFRRVVRQASIDDDDKEQLMGHVIAGSRMAYYDEKDIEHIKEAYEKCNFTREIPESEVTKLRKQLETSETKRLLQEARLQSLENQVKSLIQQLKEMTEK